MIENNTRVFVYRNLHKNLYSVRGPEGRIILHTDNIIIKNVKYCVGKKGRERVLREQCKNVHAGLRGYIDNNLSIDNFKLDFCKRITYNPYLYNSFVFEETKQQIFHSEFAVLTYENERPVIYALNSLFEK